MSRYESITRTVSDVGVKMYPVDLACATSAATSLPHSLCSAPQQKRGWKATQLRNQFSNSNSAAEASHRPREVDRSVLFSCHHDRIRPCPSPIHEKQSTVLQQRRGKPRWSQAQPWRCLEFEVGRGVSRQVSTQNGEESKRNVQRGPNHGPVSSVVSFVHGPKAVSHLASPIEYGLPSRPAVQSPPLSEVWGLGGEIVRSCEQLATQRHVQTYRTKDAATR